MTTYTPYLVGLVYMSVCSDGTKEEIEARANLDNPTGIESRWEVREPTFRTGESNPCPCNRGGTAKHWLLSC